MIGRLRAFLTAEHVQLNYLLDCALDGGAKVDMDSYELFRAGLLRHIAMEERVLLPEVRRLRNGEPLPLARRLRGDHGALAALLVPTPTREILVAIRAILADHNLLEEGPDGIYAACDQICGARSEQLLQRLIATPDVPLAPHVDTPYVQARVAKVVQAYVPGTR